MKISIVIPAKNEARALRSFLPRLKNDYPCSEIIVVNDGSTDNTSALCSEMDVIEVWNPYSLGNGGAIKRGARAASGDVVVFMDGDGQHDPSDIAKLLDKVSEGYDLVVGARGSGSQASFGRGLANGFYNRLASYMTGQNVADLTSGFRAVRREKFLEFLHLLPNGFSYPTTSTMAFFRAGYSVAYVPIRAHRRTGKSHIRPLRDGVRFLLIIFKISTLYSPLKIFFPISFSIFLIGLVYYAYTYLYFGRFTNMSALMFTTALTIFMVGLVSEQITALIYKDKS